MQRRTFLKTSAGLALAAPQVIPASAFGAGDRLVMGLIGAGGRGRGVARTFRSQGAVFAAVCDVNEQNLERGVKDAGAAARGYEEWRDVIERKDIDAVLIGTPDHHHCPMLVASVQAGKDVYCEKPMSHSIEQGAATVTALRATDRIVQIGMQRRSSESVHAAKKAIDDGLLGRVTVVKAQWNWNVGRPLKNEPFPFKIDWKRFVGPAPMRAFEPKRVRRWRYFWDYSGGSCTDQGTHLMDVVQWFMNARTPISAQCYGDVYHMLGTETPDAFSAVLQYKDFMATWTLNYNSSWNNGWSILFHGKEGTMEVNGGGWRVIKERWKADKKPEREFRGGIPTDPHVKNFLDCVKSRTEPNAPVEVGHAAVCGPHLANVSLRKEARAWLNEEATEVRV